MISSISSSEIINTVTPDMILSFWIAASVASAAAANSLSTFVFKTKPGFRTVLS